MTALKGFLLITTDVANLKAKSLTQRSLREAVLRYAATSRRPRGRLPRNAGGSRHFHIQDTDDDRVLNSTGSHRSNVSGYTFTDNFLKYFIRDGIGSPWVPQKANGREHLNQILPLESEDIMKSCLLQMAPTYILMFVSDFPNAKCSIYNCTTYPDVRTQDGYNAHHPNRTTLLISPVHYSILPSSRRARQVDAQPPQASREGA